MEVSHSLFLLQQLNVQREFGFLCDCTVAIGNVYFKAHRAVLAAFSNYFKMIFIHQSSECIKIQPTDIQPDVFSYLLHIMYTGMCPKQPVDQSRLQDGIKFLHAYQLCRKPDEGAVDATTDVVRMSNLYGIQISSQLANKDVPGVPKTPTVSRGAPEDGRSSVRGARSHSQLSLTVGLEGVPSDRQASALRNVCSVASGDDSDISSRIKQERVEEEEGEDGEGEEGAGPGSPSPAQGSSPSLLFKDRPLVLLCPSCGERCLSPEGLREHLFSHALEPARLMEGLSHGRQLNTSVEEGPRGGQEQLDAGCLEEALRQSQALANQLAAELRRSRGGGGGSSPTPAALHSRKRKIACAVCSLRFSHKSQLQEHMYTHTGKPSRYHRYNRLCSQLFQASAHFCEGAAEPGGGGGAPTAAAVSEEANRDTQDNGSSCYSLDSEISQESVDGVPVE
ncbi:zinc finger and BTB domain-containing protein 25 isoform X1 [Hippoglossus hippoglossus]|uniref:zinc finger and BTB domain-containing protein 25 n=1 Tax=Hippoglossus stenolepis TaxID=195615 RepID=UPI00148D4F95|nr:zinc finger and BTB domain-containing protein 25 isoform X1 [Hippoglossus hippoglossus]XP_034436555.1 zinc finger and BTB domain-containing protein 25 isoform X1 [Hippoglossus hippoglossus]XP_035006975.1 zinc finger and BTB domain-containing protein 25 [Hippoglossus stenolepis]XP_035006977.1 zinc finger and BTB domain-containing protein 25 [Hippoglossus stenolepis]